MKRRLAIWLTAIAGVASSLCILAAGVPAADNEFTFHNDVRLVLLDVSVHDHQGKFVPGLMRANFSVSEDGHPQVISVFDDQDAPVSMGILVDESASMTLKRTQVLTAADTLISESNPADEAFVLNFNDNVTPGLPAGESFSSKRPELRTALDRGSPRGKTALYDAVIDGLHDLRSGTRGRRTLVLITDGGDTASVHKRADVISQLEASNATVYAIGLVEQDAYEVDPGFLKQLAHISGGDAIFPQNVAGVTEACQKIAKEIRSRYTVGYIPRDSGSALRHIHVRVSAPDHSGITVLTRTSYRYDTPSK